MKWRGVLDVQTELDRQAIEVLRDAWESAPSQRGSLVSSIRVLLTADGNTVRAVPDNLVSETRRGITRTYNTGRGCNGGHDWQEVDLAATGEIVAWYCRRCDEQTYAEGW